MSAADKLAALRAQFSKNTQENSERGPSNYYPFWDMETDQRVVIRFLPDLNEDNPRLFMVEKAQHKLTINGKTQNVPCLSMYEDAGDCPACRVSRDFYKEKDETNGKAYYKKRQYIAQALVIEDPLPPGPDGQTHQGKVRVFSINRQIYDIIKNAFADQDDPLENLPYDFDNGYDFVIKKTEQGKYASYVTGTKFIMRPRALTDAERLAAEEGMVDLATLLPKNPGVDKVERMVNAALTGGDLDDDDDGGFDQTTKPAAPKQTAPTPAKAAPEPAAEPTAPVGGGEGDIDSMLAAIRAKRAARAAGG